MIMVFNSSIFQSMYNKIYELLKNVVKIIYSSTQRIQAFEDCITFMPSLFRLSKSILVSENMTTFHDQIARFDNKNQQPSEEKFVDASRETSHYS